MNMEIKCALKNLLLVVVVLLTACKDESEISATIVGKWNGREADFKVNPSGVIPAFPIHKDEFPIQLDFRNDGSLVLTDNKGVSKTGSYVQSGNQLTITIDYSFEMIDLSGTYEIRELTTADLEVEIEKQGSYTHPDSGQQFDGKVTANLFFGKSTN